VARSYLSFFLKLLKQIKIEVTFFLDLALIAAFKTDSIEEAHNKSNG
jgi:hypothetical protein